MFLEDARCAGVVLLLDHTEGGPDVTLCSSEELMDEFGCPGGNDNGPIVTVAGILKTSEERRFPSIFVDGMTDFRRVADETFK
jgi:hypothetical protein